MERKIAPLLQARIAGLLYLTIMVSGVFAEAYVRSSLIVSGNAAATAHNILACEQLYRLGGAADLLTLFCDVVIALILYNLLKPVNRSLSALAAFFRLVFSAVMAVVALTHFAPLVLLKSGTSLAAFTPAQLQALALVSLKLHAAGYNISLVFFGVHLILTGALIAKSDFLPRIIGAALAVAGACYLVNSFANFLAPAFADTLFPYILLPGFVAEGALALWLFVMGVNVARWDQQRGSRI